MMIAPREKAFSKVVGVMGDMKGAECPAPRIAPRNKRWEGERLDHRRTAAANWPL